MAKLAQVRARALDGEAPIVKQAANTQNQLDILAAIEPLARARSLRLDGSKFGFPVAQNERLERAQPRHLADLEEGFVRNGVGIDRRDLSFWQQGPPVSSRLSRTFARRWKAYEIGSPLSVFFKTWLGLNVSTRRAVMVIS